MASISSIIGLFLSTFFILTQSSSPSPSWLDVFAYGGCFMPSYKCENKETQLISSVTVCSPQCNEQGMCKITAGHTFELKATFGLRKNITSIPYVAYAFPSREPEYRFLVTHGDFCQVNNTGNPSTNITCPYTDGNTYDFAFSYTVPRLASVRPGNFTLVLDASAIYEMEDGKCSKSDCFMHVVHNVCVNCLF